MDGHLTAAVVRSQVLEPALDMVAMSHREAELHLNPHTVAADSLAEHLSVCEAALKTAIGALAHARRVQHELMALNVEELEMQRRMTRFGDDTTRVLRAAELAGQGPEWDAKKIAHLIVGCVDCLRDPAEAGEGHDAARCQMRRLFDAVPQAAIFASRAVTHAVGARRRPFLEAEYQAWEAQR